MQQKKFGTFAGVFTPSILTILGVIMYMRLGWVVGEAGLWAALGIIIIAHIISITTGLSISSIATDKKIKTGGIYYMLSRSLGLPMGGSIGFAIFIATALSISLYIVGFTESFLGIESISNFLNLEQTIGNFRIIGTIVLIIIVILAFISTSMAIKTQFFILGAIALSLISIFVGIFVGEPVTITSTTFSVAKDVDLAVIFAIFFPAVTGFTAGVAMSGDLKNPKKSIPWGTMLAIGVGLIVYVGLAISFALFVDRDLLQNDTNFLLKIAWVSPLVIAGVWGATLSSALGGILGAPRIIQALAKDKLLPKFVGKGYGINNEPRNALIITFVISEIGILIGELDTIARITSMFYIMAYGFINLAYSLEKWASIDFRPSLKIPAFVGVLGFLACVIVMVRIDVFSMLVAFAIMIIIYLILRRTQRKLDFGDVWSSVWSSIVRTSLHRADRKDLEDRNWRPNILLFSGGTPIRPKLLDFGRWLVGRYGFLSNFDLITRKNGEGYMPKKHQAQELNESEDYQGVFIRKQSCNNVYEGIKNIAQSYGFSGVEPNTVMLNYSLHSEEPNKFVELLYGINELDMNTLLVDYDNEKGFGDFKNIDIWWRGGGQNGNLSLSLVRFLGHSDDWSHTKIRLLIVSEDGENKDEIFKKANKVLENMRIDAEVRVINNQIEKKPLYEIIKTESNDADLVFLGLREIEKGGEKEFVEDTKRLCKDVATVVLVKASSSFKDIKVGLLNEEYKEEKIDISNEIISFSSCKKLLLPENEQFKQLTSVLDKKINKVFMCKIYPFFTLCAESELDLIVKNKEFVNRTFTDLLYKYHQENTVESENKILINFTRLVVRMKNSFKKHSDNTFEVNKKNFTKIIYESYADINKYLDSLPEKMILEYDYECLMKLASENPDNHKLKKLASKKKSAFIKLSYKAVMTKYINDTFAKALEKSLRSWGFESLKLFTVNRDIINQIKYAHEALELRNHDGDLNIDFIKEQQKSLCDFIDEKSKETNQSYIDNFNKLKDNYVALMNDFVRKITDYSVVKNLANGLKTKEQLKKRDFIFGISSKISSNHSSFYNSLMLELQLLNYQLKLKTFLLRIVKHISNQYDNFVLIPNKKYDAYVCDYLQKDMQTNFDYDIPRFDSELFESEVKKSFRELLEHNKTLFNNLPQTAEFISEDSLDDFYNIQFENVKRLDISVSRMLEYIVNNELLENFEDVLFDFPQKAKKYNDQLRDVNRLLSFTILGQTVNEDQNVVSSEMLGFIKNQQKRILEIASQSQKDKQDNIYRLNSKMGEVFDKLHLYSFVSLAINQKQYIKKIESKKTKYKLKNKRGKIKYKSNNLLEQVYYRQSNTVLLARQLAENSEVEGLDLKAVAQFVDYTNPFQDEEIDIPFFYEQLFISKHQFHTEFWVGREKELNYAKQVVERFNANRAGGLIVNGIPWSGKSFMAYMIAETYFMNKTFKVSRLIKGSCSINDFTQQLQKVTNIKGNADYIFSHLPQGSAVIIDDLELWWNKNNEGFDVLNIIYDLIRKYNHRIFFIICCNTYAFKSINMIRPFSELLLENIYCKPMSAMNIKNAIMLRHKSGNMSFGIKKNKSLKTSSVEMARLFNNYFYLTKGNIGLAFKTWIAQISENNNSNLTLNKAKIPTNINFRNFSPYWDMFFMQFYLHKYISVEKMSKIIFEDENNISDKFDMLSRLGLIIEVGGGVYELNPFFGLYLQNDLIKKEII